MYSIIVLSAFLTPVYSTVPPLDSYNVDSNGISVSGISSGAAMATQLHVIYSKTIMGAGLIAGVPFSCSGGSIAGALTCMNSPSSESINTFITLTITGGWFGNVDPTFNLRHAKVYIFSGTKDTVVLPGNGPHIQQYYNHFISDSNDIKTVFNINAEHSMPTVNYGGSCDQLEHNYFMNNCSYHAAYDLLNHIYGSNLQKPSGATVANGQLLTFDQSEFFHLSIPATYSMDSIGYIYVPSGCVDKSNQCKLHVALHGCQMGRVRINDTYVKHAGYNEVGELNNIIILYPQAIATTLNPKGCWDWWGYTGALFATNKGFQTTALKRMIDRAVDTLGHFSLLVKGYGFDQELKIGGDFSKEMKRTGAFGRDLKNDDQYACHGRRGTLKNPLHIVPTSQKRMQASRSTTWLSDGEKLNTVETCRKLNTEPMKRSLNSAVEWPTHSKQVVDIMPRDIQQSKRCRDIDKKGY